MLNYPLLASKTPKVNLLDFCFFYGYEAVKPNQWALILFETLEKQADLSPNVFQRPFKRLHAIAEQLRDGCYQAVNRICLLDLGSKLSLNPNIDFDVLIQIEDHEYTIRKLIEEHAANSEFETETLQPLKDILDKLPPPPNAPKPVAITPSFAHTTSSSPLLDQNNDIDGKIAAALDRKL